MPEKPNDRTAILLRMSQSDRDDLTKAAKQARLSVNGYVLSVLVGRMRDDLARSGVSTPSESSEALQAISALKQAGLSEAESRRRIGLVIEAEPDADADRIVAAAFAMAAAK